MTKKISSDTNDCKTRPVAYPVFANIRCYADCANARQKVSLVGEVLKGVILVPKGRASLIPPEAIVKTYEIGRVPKTLIGLTMMVRSLRSTIGAVCLPVSNEKTALDAISVALFSGVPTILFCWDPPGITVRDRNDILSCLRTLLIDKLLGLAIKCSKGMILNLHPKFVENRFPAQVQKKIHVFPNGTTLDKNREYLKKSTRMPKRFVVACRVNEHKGCWDVVEFFTKLYARDKEVSLVWIGGGNDQDVFRTMLDNGVSPENLIMPGDLPRDAALSYIATASFAINIYPNKPSLKWNYVLKGPEFLSFGLPIVTNDLPGICEYARDGETGIVFADGDIDDAVERTLVVLGNQKIYERMRNNAFKLAEQYDWGLINSRIAEEIWGILGGGE